MQLVTVAITMLFYLGLCLVSIDLRLMHVSSFRIKDKKTSICRRIFLRIFFEEIWELNKKILIIILLEVIFREILLCQG